MCIRSPRTVIQITKNHAMIRVHATNILAANEESIWSARFGRVSTEGDIDGEISSKLHGSYEMIRYAEM